MLGSQAGKLALSHVTSTMFDEDARRRGSGSQDDQALVSHGGQPRTNPARRVQCYNCEKMGHFSRDCPEQPKQHNQSAALTHRGGSRPKTNRMPTSYRKPSYKARVAVLSDEEDPDAFFFCTGIERGVKAEEWVVDSGATMRMTWDNGSVCHMGVFVTYMYAAMDGMPSVRLGDGRHVKAEGRGSVKLRMRDDKDAERVIRLFSVLFVPDLSCNLFSVHDITDKGNRMLFDHMQHQLKGQLCDCKWTQAREPVHVRWDR